MSDPDLNWWRALNDQLLATGRGEEDPEDAVQKIRERLGLDAVLLAVSDPSQGRDYRAVVVSDYDPTVATYLTSQYVQSCPGYAFAVSSRRASRFIDTPFDFRDTRTYQEFLGPAGFHEGITVPFTSPWSGQQGFLAANSSRGRPVSDGVLLGLTLLSGALAGAASPTLSSTEFGPTDGLLEVDQRGRIRWRRFRSDLQVLVPEAHLQALARHLRVARMSRSGFRMKGADGAWLHVKGFLTASPVKPKTMIAIVKSPPPYSITERELDILALVCRGMTNTQIAATLFISLSTVKSHIEALLRKLGVENRASLVANSAADNLWSALYLLDI